MLKKRARFALTVFLFAGFVSPSAAQNPAEVQPLWEQATKLLESGEYEPAIKISDQIIEQLLPKATDFQNGLQLNLAYVYRASLNFAAGRYAESEADLLAAAKQANAIKPPTGLPAQSLPQMMSMVHDRERICWRALADFYLASGDYEQATKSFQKAQKIRPHWETADKQNPAMAYSILASDISSMEGHFYRRIGDYERAADAYLEGLNSYETAWKNAEAMFGSNSQFAQADTLRIVRINYLGGQSNFLIELAELASIRGKHKEAIGFADRANKATLELGEIYPEWAKAMRANPAIQPETIEKTLAGVQTLADYLTFERTAKILRAAGEEKRALELVSQGNKKRGGNYRQLRVLSQESSVIRPEESLRLEGDLRASLGQFNEAVASYDLALKAIKANYPATHPARLEVFESLAIAHSMADENAKARDFADQVFEGRMRALTDVLSFADEPTRLAYRSSIDPWSIFATLELPEQLCLSVLRTKGVVLDSILEDRKASQTTTDPKLRKTLLTLNARRRELMESLLGGKADRDTNALRDEISTLEGELKSETRSDSRAALSVTIDQVAKAIPDTGALIEFIRYRDYEAPGRGTDRYGAVLLDTNGKPVFQSLGQADDIEAAVEEYGKLVRKVVDDVEMTKVLVELRKLIWEPLVPHLPKPGSRLILAPDGVLNFFSFATLLEADGTFLSEKYPIAYVTSGRDLVRGVKPSAKNSMTVLANPDFNKAGNNPGGSMQPKPAAQQPPTATVSMRGLLASIGLPPLPGADLEATIIQEIAGEQWKWPVQVLKSSDASEVAAQGMVAPKILHFATHGFFLPKMGSVDPLVRSQQYWDNAMQPSSVRSSTAAISKVTLENPMHRSGIALAGAQDTLQKWNEGTVNDTANDGILTAEEIAMLDLNGTWLVVLSACETGLGEARSGEGVLGLRRGLLQAGVENQLFTLWPVADRETVLFVRDFYTELDAAKTDPADAAHKVQTKYLKKFREKIGVAAAVRLAGPFIVSFQK